MTPLYVYVSYVSLHGLPLPDEETEAYNIKSVVQCSEGSIRRIIVNSSPSGSKVITEYW